MGVKIYKGNPIEKKKVGVKNFKEKSIENFVPKVKKTIGHYYGLCTQKMFFYGLPWDEVVDRLPNVWKWLPCQQS